jgi:hypothetical protein
MGPRSPAIIGQLADVALSARSIDGYRLTGSYLAEPEQPVR